MTRFVALFCLLAVPSVLLGQAEGLKRTALTSYADHVHERYSAALKEGEALRTTVADFVAVPSEMGLAAAREAWIAARLPYLETEVFRFYSGPIDDVDGPEGLLNAWPIDEAYVDSVEGDPDAGIINHPEEFPEITPKLLFDLNELEGEANVSTGYHAIEFLLWGQDHFADSSGRRPASDFTSAPNADRRCDYLVAATDLLVTNLESLAADWAPGSATNYRWAFLAGETDQALKNVITGMSMLCGFEMASERLLVAYDTQAQEDEHSCFSDTTHLDVLHNLQGVSSVWRIIAPVAREADPALADRLDAQITRVVELARAIPAPFDQAILGDDETPGRKSILALVEALEDQADLFVELSRALGFVVPISE